MLFFLLPQALMHSEPYVHALGALTGNMAMQQVRGGLKAIYCSGWQVAGDANTAGDVYPDQSLYPANAVPELVRKLNKVRLAAVPEVLCAHTSCSSFTVTARLLMTAATDACCSV